MLDLTCCMLGQQRTKLIILYDLYTKLISVHSNIFQLVRLTKYFKFAPTHSLQYSATVPEYWDLYCHNRQAQGKGRREVKIWIITALRRVNWMQTETGGEDPVSCHRHPPPPSWGHNVNLPDSFQLFSRIPQRSHNDFLRLNCQRFLVSSCPTTNHHLSLFAG